jgi:hypothetical protein
MDYRNLVSAARFAAVLLAPIAGAGADMGPAIPLARPVGADERAAMGLVEARGAQQARADAEYQKTFESALAEQAVGGQDYNPESAACRPACRG